MIEALEKTGSEPRNLDFMVKDITERFYFMTEKEITEAIANGSIGQYGRGYRFCTQEVGYWIFQYLESKKSKLGI